MAWKVDLVVSFSLFLFCYSRTTMPNQRFMSTEFVNLIWLMMWWKVVSIVRSVKSVSFMRFWQEIKWSFLFILANVAISNVSKMLEKANMLLLTKETTEKDRSLKTQLLLSTNYQGTEKVSGEQVWKNAGFFSMELF